MVFESKEWVEGYVFALLEDKYFSFTIEEGEKTIGYNKYDY